MKNPTAASCGVSSFLVNYVLLFYIVLSYILSVPDNDRITFALLMAQSPLILIILLILFGYVRLHRKEYKK